MDLQNLIQDRASASTKFMGETLNFKYRPALITADVFQQLESMTDSDELSTFFCDLLVSWDLTKQDRPLDIKPDIIRQLPIQLLKSMVQTIVNDVPQSESGKV